MNRLLPSVIALFLVLLVAAPARAQYVGDEYYNQGVSLNDAGRYAEAISPLSTAINQDPRNSDAYAERAWTWNKLKEYDKAIADATAALALNPGDGLAYRQRACATNAKGIDPDKIIDDCTRAIQFDRDPTDIAADYDIRGDAWDSKKEYDKAIADYSQAIRLTPRDGALYADRGDTWHKKKVYEKAIADYNEAMRLTPDQAFAFYRCSDAWCDLKEYDKATTVCDMGIRANPNSPDIYNSLAWIQATCPDAKYRDGQKAFQNASKAYQLSGGTGANQVDTLAAAYAECEDFDKAVENQKKAIELLGKDASKEDADAFRSRLELYKQKKPYRQEPTK